MTTVNPRVNKSRNNGMHLCVLGLIGAGKSTLTHSLAKVIENREGRVEALYEPASLTNPYLAAYYSNPEKYAFEMQIHLLSKRFEQQQLAQSQCLSGVSCVQDSSLFNDSCFVSLLEKDGVLDQRATDNYFNLFQNMSRFVLYPTAVIFLDTSVETCAERIRKRLEVKEGRKCESCIDPSYLWKLKIEVEQLLSGLQRYTHVLRIPWDGYKSSEDITMSAIEIYDNVKMLSKVEPIRCFQGIDL